MRHISLTFFQVLLLQHYKQNQHQSVLSHSLRQIRLQDASKILPDYLLHLGNGTKNQLQLFHTLYFQNLAEHSQPVIVQFYFLLSAKLFCTLLLYFSRLPYSCTLHPLDYSVNLFIDLSRSSISSSCSSSSKASTSSSK